MEEKRQTTQLSPEDKLSNDAGKLVDKSREALKASGAEDPSKEQIVNGIQMIVGAHRKDFNKVIDGTDGKTLSGATEAHLYTEEEAKEPQAVKAREGLKAKYDAFIDGLNLPEVDALKLKEMMSEANYVNAVETAKEMKASKIPTYEQIVVELMTYAPERLKDICEMMEKPELVIESDKSFDANVSAMNANKHYTATNGQPQEDTYVNSESRSPYRNLNKPGKVRVNVVDGMVHPKQLDGVSTGLKARRDHLTEKFAAKRMKHISPKGNASLLQQSLRRAKAANDNSLIVDNWERWASHNEPGTITFINPEDLAESTLVACSDFYSDFRQARFFANSPDYEFAFARGRASVQVLEI